MKDECQTFNKNPLLVLSYLSKKKGIFYGRKIDEDLNINQGSTSIIFKNFEKMGLVESEKVVRTILYSTIGDNPIVKHFRIFENLLEINGLVECLKQYSREILLFGSCARGDDTNNSDIDLFVVSDDDNKDKVREIIGDFKISREINPVIVNSLELIDMEENDKVFISEVNKGITLWEGAIMKSKCIRCND